LGYKANFIGLPLKKKGTLEAPQIEGSILKYRVPPLWSTYISKRRKTSAKAYGIKVRCHGENVGDIVGT
jgi:hypothetical protein